MVVDNEDLKIIFFITNALPENVNYRWLVGLPYIGSLVQNGLWAELLFPEDIRPTEKMSFLTKGIASQAEETNTFWEIVQSGGKAVVYHELEKNKTKHVFSLSDDYLQSILSKKWNLFVINNYISESSPKVSRPASDLEYWHRIDNDIEQISKAVNYESSIIIAAISSLSPGKSWIIAGGPRIAPLGNPGPLDIMDISPTVLWLLDVEIPPELKGSIITEILDSEEELTQEEMDLLTDHLRGLGYLG